MSATSGLSFAGPTTTSQDCWPAKAQPGKTSSTTCYLRDIDRDYDVFNEERTRFFEEQGLDPLPASTGIQAILCRPDLLIEIEAIAMFRKA